VKAAPLAGLGVLVTRPAAQAGRLCAWIGAAGGQAIRFPVLEIQPLMARIPALGRYDWLIFVSANAVRGLCDQTSRPLPESLRLAAVGKRTAEVMQSHSLPVTLMPESPYTSEALLQVPAFRELSGQRILIVRGVGGRERLRDTLRQRGAEVDYCEVYRRALPASDAGDLLALWRQGGVDVVTVSSLEGWDNLRTLLGAAGRELLCRTPVIAVSQRIAAAIRQVGCKVVPAVADNATDEAVFKALERWNADNKGQSRNHRS